MVDLESIQTELVEIGTHRTQNKANRSADDYVMIAAAAVEAS